MAAHPSPTAVLDSTLDMLSSYRDLFFHGLDGEADGYPTSERSGLWGDDVEEVRSGAVMHAVNHVLK